MIKKIEHIGIAVNDLEKAEALFSRLLGTAPYKREEVKGEHVITSFFKVGDVKIELLAATSPESAVYKFIQKRGEGMHHIAYETDDIRREMERLKAEGFQLINETPKEGADNKWVAFIHPKSAGGILTELCQERTPQTQDNV